MTCRVRIAAKSAAMITPHVAQNLEHNGGSAVDARTTRLAVYVVSQRQRKLVEEIFGWSKILGIATLA